MILKKQEEALYRIFNKSLTFLNYQRFCTDSRGSVFYYFQGKRDCHFSEQFTYALDE